MVPAARACRNAAGSAPKGPLEPSPRCKPAWPAPGACPRARAAFERCPEGCCRSPDPTSHIEHHLPNRCENLLRAPFQPALCLFLASPPRNEASRAFARSKQRTPTALNEGVQMPWAQVAKAPPLGRAQRWRGQHLRCGHSPLLRAQDFAQTVPWQRESARWDHPNAMEDHLPSG